MLVLPVQYKYHNLSGHKSGSDVFTYAAIQEEQTAILGDVERTENNLKIGCEGFPSEIVIADCVQYSTTGVTFS